MTHHTDAERAELLQDAQAAGFGRIVDGVVGLPPAWWGQDISALEAFDKLRAARRAPAVPVPQGWKLVPVTPTAEQLRAGYWSGGGDIRLHEEWARKESYERMVHNAPQPPEAAPVQMPEPDAWRYTDARGHYRYRGIRPGFAVEYPLLKPDPLYTEHQVSTILAQHGIKTK